MKACLVLAVLLLGQIWQSNGKPLLESNETPEAAQNRRSGQGSDDREEDRDGMKRAFMELQSSANNAGDETEEHFILPLIKLAELAVKAIARAVRLQRFKDNMENFD
ncbi:hypothetical protein MTO96_010113 [Rhipicephalus appendiculatus]